MDLNLLTTFAAVAETRSFSLAAKKLGLPNSSVSRSIARLEEITAAQLFHRTTRRVALSQAGTELYDRVLPSLQRLASAVRELPDSGQEPVGELRITGPADPSAFFLSETCVRFTTRYPNAKVDLTLTNRRVDLVAEGFDMGIRVGPGPLQDSSLIARKLAPIHVQLYASPAYLARHGAPRVPRDLDRHEWVVFRPGPKRLVLGGGIEVTPRGRIQSDDMGFTHAVLCAGGGIGFLPQWLAEKDVAAGTLVPVLPRHGQSSGHIYLLYPGGGRVPSKVTAFRDLMIEVLKARGM